MTVKPVQNRGSGNKSDGRDDKETHQNAVTGVGAEPNSAGHGTSSRSSVAHGPLIHRNVARDNTGKVNENINTSKYVRGKLKFEMYL